jgi:uncharacterized small protein (DUF1192 family)
VRERFMMDQDDANSDFIAHARQDTPSLLSIVRELQARVAELERQCERCGLKIAHELTPGVNYGPVVTTHYPPVVTNTPDQPAQVTFYPQEVVYTPGELSQYPSKTVGAAKEAG